MPGALAVLALLAVAALARPAGPIVLVVLVAAFIAIRTRRPTDAALVGAAIPVAVAIAWGGADAPVSIAGDCANPLAPVAVWRLVEMTAVVAALAALLGLRTFARPAVVPFERPSGALVGALLALTVAVAVGALVIGPLAAQAFFGRFELELAPLALVPAVVFGTTNAIAEEFAYRGVLRGGLVSALRSRRANVAQAAIFALAHTGPDFVGSPLPVLALMFVGAFIAGEVVVRTRSLLVPIALHAAFDLPIFFYWACRLA